MALKFSNAQMAAADRLVCAGFEMRLLAQLREDFPQYADFLDRAGKAFVQQAYANARRHKFRSERSIAFWANVGLMLPSNWFEHPDLSPSLSDIAPSEPDRLFRLKTSIETANWSG